MRGRLPAEHFESLEKQDEASSLGMWVFLSSELLLFAALFALYGAYRAMYPSDFAAAADHNNVIIGTANTLILITSSLTVAMSVGAVRASKPGRAARLLALSLVLAAAFLVLKGIEYGQHFREGIYPGVAYRLEELRAPGAILFFSLYYVATGLHALHVVAGMCVLGWLAWGCHRERYSAENATRVELGGLYWHLVDIIWIFLWPLLYLTRK